MFRTSAALSATTLLAAVALTIAGCSTSGSATPSSGTSGSATSSSGTSGSSTASGTAAPSQPGTANSGTACSHGLQPGATGVVDIACGGTATIHITAGSVSESIAGGTCHRADNTWTVTAGVITQYGVYHGPPVDVVTVAATVGKDASVQAELGDKMLLVGSASFALSAGGKSAHVSGTSDRNADIANAPVTVDVTC